MTSGRATDGAPGGTLPPPPSGVGPGSGSGSGTRLAMEDAIALNKALALMLAHPTLIRRPVLDVNGKIIVGFKPELYQQAI